MPLVNVDVKTLWELMGIEMTYSKFEDLCFDFGIELEEATTSKELGKDGPDREIYRIDIPANRYDMLCVEGIARACAAYLGIKRPPQYKLTEAKEILNVKKETSLIRPFVVAAILRDITFDQFRYDNFIELQDKLHNNICRKRTLVAIGTHDLDTISGPFSYEARTPEKISFVPLNQTEKMNGNRLMEFYENDRKLSKFLHIIKDSPVYPVIYDSKDRVLSLPPIINGDHSKIKLTTKNVLIECTATDMTKAKIVLNTIVTMFSAYCAAPFTIEPVTVVYEDGRKEVHPDIFPKNVSAKVEYINSCVGINESAESLVELVKKMSLDASLSKDKSELLVQVPPTRADILHACDIMEDCAIAYNINRIKKTFPKANCVAKPLAINKLSDMLRTECAMAGYTEALAFTLCSHDENYKFLNKPDDGLAVLLANPKTIEYQVVRTSLMPGLLKTVSANKHLPLPLKLFEVSDIVLRDESQERRARNQKNICALWAAKTSGFEQIHGLVDRLMQQLGVKKVKDVGYHITESESRTFFAGRCADIWFKGKKIGNFGIVHPEVLAHFEIGFPCSVLEFNVEPFL